MSIAEVRKLPLREQFQIMEVIWSGLSECADSGDIPEEHRILLDQRRARVAAGEARIHDWDQVKHTIGNR